MFALFGAGLEIRLSSRLMRKGYREPWAPQDRKKIARKYAPEFRRGMVSGGIAQVFDA
jgi:hypothetical protein